MSSVHTLYLWIAALRCVMFIKLLIGELVSATLTRLTKEGRGLVRLNLEGT